MLHPDSFAQQYENDNANTITWHNKLNAWVVSNYELVLAILKNPIFSAAAASIAHQPKVLPTSNPPNPARPRILTSLQAQQPWSKALFIAQTQLACHALKQEANFDLMGDLIRPCCQKLALQLTGCTEGDSKMLLQQAHAVFHINDDYDQAIAATQALTPYFLTLIQKRQQSPQQDFISLLVQEDIPAPILVSPIIQLFVGLATSLPLLLGNIFFSLWTNPSQISTYLKQPKATLNELLRYAGPAQVLYRLALQDCNIGGHLFKRGDRIALLLAQANYDATKFPAAEQLDLKRQGVGQLSLGKGQHACLGMPIIRDAMELIPHTILKELPNLKPQLNRLQWGGSSTIQGLTQLPVDNL